MFSSSSMTSLFLRKRLPQHTTRSIASRRNRSESAFRSVVSKPSRRRNVLFCGADFPHTIEFARKTLRSEFYPIAIHRAHIKEEIQKLGVDVLVPLMCRIDRQIIECGAEHGLKLIHQFGTGLEGVDGQAAAQAGIAVLNIPANDCGNAASCAEHVIWMILSLLRKPAAMTSALQARRLGTPFGSQLIGKTALIVGFGAIGKEIALRLRAFGTHILAARKSAWSSDELAMLDHGETLDTSDPHRASSQLADLAARCDIIIACCPLTPGTRGIIGEKVLSALPPGALVINVARGAVVDRSALVEAMKLGKLGGVGLDVWWQEPFDDADADQGGVAPMQALAAAGANVVMTPHVAGVTDLSQSQMAAYFARSLHRFFAPAHG